MINYQLFPRSIGLSTELERIVQCFDAVNHIICSDANNLSSNEVLSAIRSNLEDADFLVETGKSNKDKIHVPVLFGHNNKIDKSFYADALSRDGKIVIEIEAGRATENNQFLKDIFQACMMHKVICANLRQ